jgi:hypothetical protein
MDTQPKAETETTAKLAELPYFSCKYGEDTKLGISVKHFAFTVHALLQQEKALVGIFEKGTHPEGGISDHCCK